MTQKITRGRIANSTLDLFTISDLDDVSNLVDGRRINFPLQYNTSNVSVNDAQNLMVVVNGVVQKPYSNNYTLTNGANTFNTQIYAPTGGFMLDSDGTIRFSEPVPMGSTIQIRVVPSIANTATRVYPYKPIDILMGD